MYSSTVLRARQRQRAHLRSARSDTIRNTPLRSGLGHPPPVGEPLALLLELLALHRLGEHVGKHALRPEVLDSHLSPVHLLLEPEVADLDVTRWLSGGPAALHQRHATEVVLVDHRRPRLVSLRHDEVAHVDRETGGVG